MKPTGIISTLAAGLLAITSVAFQPPAGSSNGVYQVTVDGSGNIVTGPTLVAYANANGTGLVSPNSTTNPGLLPNPQQICPVPAHFINRYDFVGAWTLLDAYCANGPQIGNMTHVYAQYRSSIAYMCNYATANRCYKQEQDESTALLDIACGQSNAGSVAVQALSKSYGRDNAGVNICTMAL